jgi:pyruvate kinase
MPSRSEVTDAAMGERAECVMLNKGPYLVTAVSVLADILTRMQAHQNKKQSTLRQLHVATSPPEEYNVCDPSDSEGGLDPILP